MILAIILLSLAAIYCGWNFYGYLRYGFTGEAVSYGALCFVCTLCAIIVFLHL